MQDSNLKHLKFQSQITTKIDSVNKTLNNKFNTPQVRENITIIDDSVKNLKQIIEDVQVEIKDNKDGIVKI